MSFIRLLQLPAAMPLSATLVLLLLSLCCAPATTHAQSTPLPPVNYSIPTFTYGPAFTNPNTIAYLNTTYYNSSLPTLNLSWPVIKLAGVITLNGQYNTYAVFMQQLYSFMVDMINAKGGIVVAGIPHLLSITWASDDSSTSMLLYLYQQWMNDPSYSIFLTPTQDPQLILLNQLMLGSNRTFFNFFAGGPADFTARYPYIFTMITTRDQVPVNSMILLNQRAAQYHSDVQSGAVSLSYQGETTNRFGVQNVCLYTHYDPTQLLSCGGIRAWINTTNQARLAAGATQRELIVVEQDVLWNIPSTSVDQNLYTTTMTACPDHVDLLVVCGTTSFADSSAVSAALAATQLRPKAAFTTSTLPTYTATNATLAAQWPGWCTYGSYPAPPASLPGPPTFSTLTQFKRDWSTYFNITVASVTSITVLQTSGLEIIKAALASTASLSSADLRVAFLGLSGNTYIRNVKFSAVNGINSVSVSALGQIQLQAGLVVPTSAANLTVPGNVSGITFPAPWPWSRVQVGDSLIMAQSSTNVIVGWVLVMLGCWVALIIVEQAVFVRRRGGWYKVWLGLVAISLGGAGVWCSQWTMSSAVSLTKPEDTSTLPMSLSLDIALLAQLPALILTWCGLYMLMRDVEDNSKESTGKHNNAAHIARQVNKEQRAEKRKRAALSYRAHFYHLKDCMSRNVLAGSVLIAMAVGFTRVTLWYNWSVQATTVSSAAGWVVSAIVAVLLLCPALLMYFHALKLRTVAVFMLAGAVMVDWQVHIYTMTFKYAAAVLLSPVSLYTLLLSPTSVQLITGILTAITCFGFIGLQFSRMQLSRNGLSVLVASLESVINKQKAALREQEHQLGNRAIQSDELVRMLEAINIVRPIPKEYAWALASCSNTSTFRQQVDQVTAGHLHGSFITATNTGTPVQSTTRLSTTITAHSASPVLVRSASSTTDNSITGNHVSTPTTASRFKGTAIIALAHTDKDGTELDEESMVDSSAAAHHEVASSTASKHSSRATCQVAPARTLASPSQSTTAKRILQPSNSNQLEVHESNVAAEPSKTSDSANSLSVSAHVAHIDHHNRWKQFETDLTALLHQQTQNAAVAALEHPHIADGSRASVSSITGKGRGSQSMADDAEFAMGAAAKSKPTLMELLAHPVCVELLKDELERIHSVENLVFYLHAVRYRHLQTAKTRRMLATLIFDTFVAEGAAQQINISTRQRDTIQAQLRKRGDDSATPTLFREAEREVAMLMETNVMKGSFVCSSAYRVCALVLASLDVDKASGKWGEERRGGGGSVGGGDGWSDGRTSLVTDMQSGKGSRTQYLEASRVASSMNKD